MAVTGAIFNSLSFGGVNSADYGIYITGEAVFNAPKRAVEMVSVPGRNGSIAIDQGHWENLEVTYPAGTFGMDESEFRTALSNFRNAIVSQIGYQRLTDTYHPDEYRMALYAEGLEVEATTYNSAGEFELTFDCKPQRWLTNGETAVTVTSGDTLTNPTPYDAGPLVEAFGYGNINISGQEIQVLDVTLDEQTLTNDYVSLGTFVNTINIDLSQNLNAISLGDTFYVDGINVTEISTFTLVPIHYTNLYALRIKADYPQTPSSALTQIEGTKLSANTYRLSWNYQKLQFVYGTPSTTPNYVGEVEYEFQSDSDSYLSYRPYTFYAEYDGNKRLTFHIDGSDSFDMGSEGFEISGTIQRTITIPKIIGVPSLSRLNKYIDLTIGECYAYLADEMISWNSAAILPSDLPTLASGANEITYDDTITELKITPNWWKL